MRHQKKFRKLGRSTAHRFALFRNQVSALIEHERIVTTTAKAKELRRIADKVVTLARKQNTRAMARAESWVPKKELRQKLFTTLAQRYKFRPCGYTRVLKIGQRPRDAAHMSVIEFVDREGELRKARPCNEDTIIRALTCTSPMFKKIHEKTGYKGFAKSQYMIDLMHELKAAKKAQVKDNNPNE